MLLFSFFFTMESPIPRSIFLWAMLCASNSKRNESLCSKDKFFEWYRRIVWYSHTLCAIWKSRKRPLELQKLSILGRWSLWKAISSSEIRYRFMDKTPHSISLISKKGGRWGFWYQNPKEQRKSVSLSIMFGQISSKTMTFLTGKVFFSFKSRYS